MHRLQVCVLVPAHNEAETLPELFQRLTESLDGHAASWQLLIIDDGSSDSTWSVVKDLRKADERVSGLRLSRNFGKEIAMSAGLERARGDAVVVMDADLQDPPELIPDMLDKLAEGYDVVYGQRVERPGESWLKRLTAHLFYRIINLMSRTPIPKDTGDFRVLSRRAVNALNRLPEHHRFMKGLFAWIGYRQVALRYHRDPRLAGRTKFNYLKLWHFAVDGITSFSATPLRVATIIGLVASVAAVVYGLVIIIKTLAYGDPVQGYPSLMVTVLFLGGAQLLALGIMGEYLGRLFDETKRRPLYLVDEELPADQPRKESSAGLESP